MAAFEAFVAMWKPKYPRLAVWPEKAAHVPSLQRISRRTLEARPDQEGREVLLHRGRFPPDGPPSLPDGQGSLDW